MRGMVSRAENNNGGPLPAEQKRKTKMKKLMILLAAVASAAAMQAAQVDWSIASKSFSSYDSATTYNVTSYLLAFSTTTAYNTFAAGVGNGSISFATAVSDYSVGSATGSTGKTAGKVDTTLTSAKLTEGTEYVFAVFSTSGTDKYILSTTTSGIAYDPAGTIETEGLKAAFIDTNFSAGWQTVSAEPVPEPTGGLLTLLGIGMLALRRKRM